MSHLAKAEANIKDLELLKQVVEKELEGTVEIFDAPKSIQLSKYQTIAKQAVAHIKFPGRAKGWMGEMTMAVEQDGSLAHESMEDKNNIKDILQKYSKAKVQQLVHRKLGTTTSKTLPNGKVRMEIKIPRK